ncbi:MAG: allantoinase AllB [Williamsia sp.]|nr:allantoinase AllB [Williamsia sp.]
MYDAVIKSNRVITGTRIGEAWIAIKDGVIAEVWQELPEGLDQAATDLGELVLMAGVVDPHVHINEPGRTDWEGFDTATRAALAGGVTTLIDMPLNAVPVTITVSALGQKIACAQKQAHVNIGFWGGIVPGNKGEIEGLIKGGVCGFKAFLTHSGIEEFPNATEADLRSAMPLLAQWNLPLLVHCELTDQVTIPAGANPASYPVYLSSRPHRWEDNAIKLMIRLCEELGCRVHIVHLASSYSIERIRVAKEKGLPLTVETAQHYLYFQAEEIADGQTSFKCAPPIRDGENKELLWKALQEGIIDFVATDHSPASPEMKALQTGNFLTAWGGISSIQFALPALWTAARTRNISLPQIAEWLCEKPALLAGLGNRKGKIQQGYDADLIAWNPDAPFVVTPSLIHHKHKLTPYLNEKLFGTVEQVWLKGEPVYAHPQFLQLNGGEIV